MKIVLLLAVGATLVFDDTPMWRSDTARSGVISEKIEPDASIVSSKWSVNIGLSLSTPTVVNGRVYVGSTNGYLYCRSEKDGAPIWSYYTGAGINSSVTYDKGRVYFNARNGKLYCLHSATGSLYWEYYHGGDSFSSPTVKSGMVYLTVGSPYNRVIAVDAITARLVWVYDTGQISQSSAAWGSDKIVLGDNTGKWICLDAFTGDFKWSYKSNSTGILMATCAIWNNIVALCTGEADRYLYFLDLNTGLKLKDPAVKVWSPGFGKPGSSGTSTPIVINPTTVFDTETLQSFLGLDKAQRDEEVQKRGEALGKTQEQIDSVKKYLDEEAGDTAKSKTSFLSDANIVMTSSPCFSGGKVIIIHREFAGSSDDFFGCCIDYTSNTVLWGTPPISYSTSNEGIIPSPAISAGQYAYFAIGKNIEIRNLSSGALLHSIDTGAQIIGGVTLANAKIYVTTSDGYLKAYSTLNNPPSEPTSLNPSGGLSITHTSRPTIIWAGHYDLDNDPVQSEIQTSLNNSDVETNGITTVLSTGQSSYTFSDSLASGTTVYYRLRIRDIRSGIPSAYSVYTEIQSFTVLKDEFAPDPISNLSALPLDSKVKLTWQASPSPDVVKYRVYYKKNTEQWSSAAIMDNITASPASIINLTNNQTYDFMVTAVDGSNNESQGVTVSAIPLPEISVNGVSYSTIQAAVNAALPGQTVQLGIRETPFYTNISLKPGVNIQGYSPKHSKILGAVSIDASQSPADTPASTISNISISGGIVGVHITSATVIIRNTIIHHVIGSSGDAVYADSKSDVQVINCTISDNDRHGVNSASQKTTVRNTLVSKNKGQGIVMAGGTLEYNNSTGNPQGDYPTGVAGIGNISTEVKFTDSDYSEDSFSPGVDTGHPDDDFSTEPQPNGSRINQGAYGNTQYAAISPNKVVLTSDNSGGGGGSSSKFCFVATTLLASSDGSTLVNLGKNDLRLTKSSIQKIEMLCDFRDEFMKTNPMGHFVTESYYGIAPQVSESVHKSPLTDVGLALLSIPISIATLSYSTKLFFALFLTIAILAGIQLRLKSATKK